MAPRTKKYSFFVINDMVHGPAQIDSLTDRKCYRPTGGIYPKVRNTRLRIQPDASRVAEPLPNGYWIFTAGEYYLLHHIPKPP